MIQQIRIDFNTVDIEKPLPKERNYWKSLQLYLMDLQQKRMCDVPIEDGADQRRLEDWLKYKGIRYFKYPASGYMTYFLK